MQHQDLGEMSGTLLLFGGPYSNAQATEAMIAEAGSLGVAPDQMICTGDVVAYCGAPVRTVRLLRELGCAVVAGNCEIQLGSGASDCGCGFEEGTHCDLLSAAWYAHATAALAPPDIAWMAERPHYLSFWHHGARYGVIHGGITDVARFIWESSPEEVFRAEWRAAEAIMGPLDNIIAGHCGVPFLRDTAQGRWINAGVIGMPPHNGRPQTIFATLSKGAVTFHELQYDVNGAMADMKQAGLPARYREGLQTGYWPSEDVLPQGLRRDAPVSASG